VPLMATSAPLTSGGLGVTSAVILAALLHAAWNAAAHRINDRAVASALIGSASAVAGLCVVPWVRVPSGAAWPYLLGSVAVHVVYLLLLMRSYRLGDFNRMYPLARGTSPLVVAVLAVTVVGQPLSGLHAAGVVAVSAGLAVLVLAGGAFHSSDRSAVTAAVLTGLAIASSTVLDGVGVRHAGSTLGYIGWLFLLQGPIFPLLMLAQRRRRLLADVRPFVALGLVSGLVSVAAYGIVIWAQTRSNLASVAALRELSIVFAAVIGMVFFHERFGWVRTAGAALAVVGVLLLNQ
jgi:drug/metabolite transporter (DMT)-like permease